MKEDRPSRKDSGDSLQLLVSPDRLEARILTPVDFKRQIIYGDVIDLLDRSQIRHPIGDSELQGYINRYNQGEYIREFPVARGFAPVDPQPGHVEILVKATGKVHFDEKGRADYRNVARFRTVKKGQAVARFIPSQPGKPGMDIYGSPILPPKERQEKPRCGPNVEFNPEQNLYIATTSGVFTEEEHQISVNSVLTIEGNTGLVSGNVIYEGNIKILKNITRGTYVSCLGDLEVGGVIESGHLRIGGSLTVGQGVNTKKEDLIRINANLVSTYLENSSITVGGSALISKSVSASKLVVHEDLTLSGRSASILGGELLVFGSISAGCIGNQAGTPTKISLGVHDKNNTYYEVFHEQLEAAEAEFRKLEQEMIEFKGQLSRLRGKVTPTVEARVREKYKEYSQKQKNYQSLREHVANFKQLRYNSRASQVIVREAIFPGVVIYYRNHTERIKAPMHKIVLTFSPNKEEPSFAPYKE